MLVDALLESSLLMTEFEKDSKMEVIYGPPVARKGERVERIGWLWRTFCTECGQCLNVSGHKDDCSRPGDPAPDEIELMDGRLGSRA